MNNSYVEVLEGLYTGIFADIRCASPNDHEGLERDLSRLLSLVETRGLSFLTIDLPSAGKIFDRSLADGFLHPIALPGFGNKVKGSVVPKFLSGLLLKVFQPSGVLLEQPDITAILFLRQLFYAAKKLRIPCDEQRNSEAVSAFLRIETVLRPASLNWVADDLDCGPCISLHFADAIPGVHDNDRGWSHGRFGEQGRLEFLEEPETDVDPLLLDTLQQCADIVSSSFGWFDPSEWKQKHGPGAVSDLRGGSSKYSFPTWPDKLESMFPLSEFAFANYGIWAQSVNEDSIAIQGFSKHEPPAKLIAVPKTQKGPRLIASEPTAHQWAQQSLNEFLRKTTEKVCIAPAITFNSQEPNQAFALEASATGSHATIDLSSASDRLSLWVVERFFRRNHRLLRALHSCRTRWLVNEIDERLGKYIVLNKLAAQGAAFTFPTQTIVYATTAIACMLYTLKLPVTTVNIRAMARQVRVFGDDIIVPIGVWETVANTLEVLGFEVNQSKTFGTGKFRESCGLDAYDGVEISPAYYLQAYDKSRPASVSSLVECSNNFYKKGFWHTAAWIISTLPQWVIDNLPVVPADSGSFGLNSFCGYDLSHLKVRYNVSLQREEIRAATLRVKVNRKPAHWEANLLQYFTEAPNPDDYVKWTAGVDSLPKDRVVLGWAPREEIIVK
ncbi:MAG: putative replicase protein [Leviviridae sp.]|nr:MAG: putative replicase protein [Leviviridae sp.]